MGKLGSWQKTAFMPPMRVVQGQRTRGRIPGRRNCTAPGSLFSRDGRQPANRINGGEVIDHGIVTLWKDIVRRAPETTCSAASTSGWLSPTRRKVDGARNCVELEARRAYRAKSLLAGFELALWIWLRQCFPGCREARTGANETASTCASISHHGMADGLLLTVRSYFSTQKLLQKLRIEG